MLQSSAPGLPADRNIAYDSAGNFMTVNSEALSICQPKTCYTCAMGIGELAGTGMAATNPAPGAGTPWLTVTAPVVPGETIELDLMIFDVSDGIYDSVVLFDNFQWVKKEP